MVSVRRVPDGDLVGVCTGHRRGDASAELAGLGVLPERRREGIGTRLVEQFEENAAEGGFARISVGSAGGDVDNFYAALGYEPESELVRLDAGVVDHEYLDAVRETLDEEAIYIVRKSLERD